MADDQAQHLQWLREDLAAMEARLQAAIVGVHSHMNLLDDRTRRLEQDFAILQEKDQGRWRWLTPVSLAVVMLAQIADWLGWGSPPSAP